MALKHAKMNPEDITIAILCGGPATRLYPLTQEIPKALVPIGGVPIVEDMILHLKKQGFRKFMLCERHLSEMIQEHFSDGGRLGVEITHIVEPEALGTAGALKFAAPHLSETFIAIQGDLLLRADLRKMLAFHERHGADTTLLVHKSSHPEDSDLIATDDSWRVTRVFRPHDGERFINMGNAGVFVFKKKLLDEIPEGKRFIEKDWLPRLLIPNKIAAYYTEEYVKDMGTMRRMDETNERYMALQEQRPAAFLDRDGVIVHDKNLMTRRDQLELIPGAARAIKELNNHRVPVIVVTNQPVVARNLCTEDDVHRMHDALQLMLLKEGAHIDAFYFCPHHPERGHAEADDPRYRRECDCRKPNPGMLLQAAEEHRLDLKSSVMVGDRESDVIAGMTAGCTSILVGDDGSTTAAHKARDLEEAVGVILDTVTNDVIKER